MADMLAALGLGIRDLDSRDFHQVKVVVRDWKARPSLLPEPSLTLTLTLTLTLASSLSLAASSLLTTTNIRTRHTQNKDL
jgi:hypothetical protein